MANMIPSHYYCYRSGKEGFYPDLIKFTEGRIAELNPNRYDMECNGVSQHCTKFVLKRVSVVYHASEGQNE